MEEASSPLVLLENLGVYAETFLSGYFVFLLTYPTPPPLVLFLPQTWAAKKGIFWQVICSLRGAAPGASGPTGL